MASFFESLRCLFAYDNSTGKALGIFCNRQTISERHCIFKAAEFFFKAAEFFRNG